MTACCRLHARDHETDQKEKHESKLRCYSSSLQSIECPFPLTCSSFFSMCAIHTSRILTLLCKSHGPMRTHTLTAVTRLTHCPSIYEDWMIVSWSFSFKFSVCKITVHQTVLAPQVGKHCNSIIVSRRTRQQGIDRRRPR